MIAKAFRIQPSELDAMTADDLEFWCDRFRELVAMEKEARRA